MDSKKREKRYRCDKCPSAFDLTSHLKTHTASVHSEERPFRCEHCDYSAKLKWNLQKHYAKHFPQVCKTQSCPECPYKCTNLAKLLSHSRVHTKEKPFACQMCTYKTSTRSVLTEHIRSHTGEKPFKCHICNLTFSYRNSLERHKLFVHSKKDVSVIACSFPGCDRTFTVKQSLKSHVESIHNKESRFSCPFCEKLFFKKSNCVSHIRHRHTKERPFKCSVCEYAATTSRNLKRHESSTHGEYMAVECPICHRRYKNNQSLAMHHFHYHKNEDKNKEAAPKWKCKESGCTKEYKTRQGLKQHVNSIHLQHKLFKCLFCAHTTTTSSNLNLHLKRHTREKPYSCDLCKRCFISAYELSTHKETAHSELRQFQCELCTYSAKTNEA